MEHQQSIVVLDFGGQYAHLIARRVRQLGVYADIMDADTPVDQLRGRAGIILSGGPQSVYDPQSPQGDPAIFELGIPVLGICYGLQWMVKALGGSVESGGVKEYGRAKLKVESGKRKVTDGLPVESTVWMSHGDEAKQLPEGFERIGTSADCQNAFLADETRNFYAVQFHPEVVHSEYGQQLLKNFVGLCDTLPWSIDSYADHISASIQQEVGERKVFILVSGGVDSTVAFVLLNKVLGTKRVQGLYVDTGLMRKDESKEIETAFADLGITNLRIEYAEAEFLKNLEGVYDPEEKRNIIGKTFLDVQRRVSSEMGLSLDDGWMLGQGTIYPDTIETGETKNADKIKTHHNRIEEIQKMMDAGFVIEPLRELYKDEVRTLGQELGIPQALVWRHPFPGPGLGVRILCAEQESRMTNDELQMPSLTQYFPLSPSGCRGMAGATVMRLHCLISRNIHRASSGTLRHRFRINHRKSIVSSCVRHTQSQLRLCLHPGTSLQNVQTFFAKPMPLLTQSCEKQVSMSAFGSFQLCCFRLACQRVVSLSYYALWRALKP